MNKQALLFPGQGSQFDQMGIDWCRCFTKARLIYEEAEDLLKLNVLKFSADEKTFHQSTIKTQLAIFTHSIAIWNVLCDQGFVGQPICSGMSLGEFSALIAAKKARFGDLLALIEQRAHIMQKLCEQLDSGMAAVVGLSAERLKGILKQANCENEVWIANFNTPSQMVISGSINALDRVNPALLNAGGRIQRLNVAGAFHSPLMKSAQKQWSSHWQQFFLTDSSIDFVSSISGQKENDSERLHSLIEHQIVSPVLWSSAALEIQSNGPMHTIEVGSEVLKGLQRRIDNKIKVISIKSVKDLAQLTKQS